MSAHTPGPWSIEPVCDAFDVYPESEDSGPVACECSEADARLIAAAPELLDALVALTSTKQETGRGWNERIRQARAAIAKAEAA